MSVLRLVLTATAGWSVGAHDWRGLAGTLVVAAAIELGALTFRVRENRALARWRAEHRA